VANTDFGLAATFNTAADLYNNARPGYPAALYADVFRYCPVGQGSHALEIGIGAGQATLPVLKTGCAVTAVELGDNLAALVAEKFAQYPFKVCNLPYQRYDAPDNTYDLIYSASAFHWIPEEIGYSKAFAQLKPGGAFARFANHPSRDLRDALHRDIQALYEQYMPGSRPPKPYTEAQAQERAEIALKYGFVEAEHRLYYRDRSFTAKKYVELLGTYSDHIALPLPVRIEFFARMEETILAHGDRIVLNDVLDLQLARKPL